MAIRVAVCTNRRPDQTAECVSALRGQIGDAPLALVTSGLEDVSGHRATFPGEVLEEPRPGLSRARNRALAWTPDGEVLAFVDDDAVVADGWWEALRRAWAAAPPEVAWIGGPIRPRFAVRPPDWVSDAILPALTLLDLGDEVRDLDPSVKALYGANISFRAGPLRQAGGFDPAYGHAGSTVFFAEEDEAQQALARLGYRGRYVPDAAVWHVIPSERLTRASFVRRRFAFGQTLGMHGRRRRATAARHAVMSAAGALMAAARGNQARAMERAVRAAENAGVLAAPPPRDRAR